MLWPIVAVDVRALPLRRLDSLRRHAVGKETMSYPTTITIQTSDWGLLQRASRYNQRKPYPSRSSILRIFGGEYFIEEINYEIHGGHTKGEVILKELVPIDQPPPTPIDSFAPSIRDFSDRELIEEVKRRETEWRKREQNPNEMIDQLKLAAYSQMTIEEVQRLLPGLPVEAKDGGNG